MERLAKLVDSRPTAGHAHRALTRGALGVDRGRAALDAASVQLDYASARTTASAGPEESSADEGRALPE